jgi:hypothetical protein
VWHTQNFISQHDMHSGAVMFQFHIRISESYSLFTASGLPCCTGLFLAYNETTFALWDSYVQLAGTALQLF